IANVTVRLRSASTHEIVRVTQTAPDGYYIFSNVPAGSYYVEFVLPYGYGFTKANQGGNDELDSDADPATGKTASFTLNADKLDLDAGLVELPQGDLCVEDMESTVDALGHYSLIVLDDITGSGHSEGRVFVGGNWLMGGTQPLGHNIPDPVPCSDMALTVVGNIGNNSQIQVLNGGATYGGSILGGSAIQMN